MLLVAALAMGIAPRASAELIDYGKGLIYDSDLDVTWLQDANYPKTSGSSADGKLDASGAFEFAAQLSLGGSDDWRLPEQEELQQHLYQTQGVSARQPAPFINLQADWYYTSTPAGNIPDGYRLVHMGDGGVQEAHPQNTGFVMLLFDGQPPDTSEEQPVPVGQNVEAVFPISGVSISFGEVTAAGEASVEVNNNTPAVPEGYQIIGDAYDMTTSAVYNPVSGIIVSVPWCGHCMPVFVPWCGHCSSAELEPHLELMHYEQGSWQNVTTTVDTTSGAISGMVASLSPFAVMLLMDPVAATVDLIDTVEGMNLKKGIRNSLYVKLSNALSALTDKVSGNDASAVNKLRAFVNQCEAQSGKNIAVDQANKLVSMADAIIQVLSH
jgi:hypothetical protein